MFCLRQQNNNSLPVASEQDNSTVRVHGSMRTSIQLSWVTTRATMWQLHYCHCTIFPDLEFLK